MVDAIDLVSHEEVVVADEIGNLPQCSGASAMLRGKENNIARPLQTSSNVAHLCPQGRFLVTTAVKVESFLLF